jgi:large repetitive protein
LKENFDRFNFAIYKEKEMADFRRLFTALALVALFVGLASAQSGAPGTVSCTTTSGVTPLVRPEGNTELVGDIILACTNSSNSSTPPLGTPIPTANITIFMQQQVTSRIIGSGSEALLMIDEPGASPVTGYGNTVPQTVCTTPLGGCPEFVGNTATGFSVPVQAPGTNVAGWNVFQGVVAGNTVTFYGVPILPPTTAPGGNSHVMRITNVRTNVAGFGGAAAGTGLTANISVSPGNAFSLNNSTLSVAYIGNAMQTATRKYDNSADTSTPTSLLQCSGPGLDTNFNSGHTNGPQVLGLRFTPGFPTAFKTRLSASNPGWPINYMGPQGQNIPGQVYNSESGFLVPVSSGSSTGVAGLADFGTRLKASFTNIPSGVTIYVSATNFVPSSSTFQTAGVAPYAAAVITETVPDANGILPAPTALSKPNGYVQLTPVNGSAYQTWEVLASSNTTVQDYEFGVVVTYSTLVPTASSITVNMSLAPNASNGAFTTTAGGVASSTLPIPRFVDTSTGKTLANINICQTVLLFPFVTTASGLFETGLAISNTSQDPFGTTGQSGTCTLNWYQAGVSGTNPPVTTTPSVGAGTTYTTLASATTNAGPNFTGYMFAICNFQYGHGYAAITDVGARGILSSYLALVAPNRSTGAIGESLVH